MPKVHRAAGSLGADSPTSDYEAVHERVEEQVRGYAERIELPQNAVGVVVAVNDKIQLADVFDKPDTLGKLWGKLIRGYAVGALDRRGEKAAKKKPAPESAREFLRRASEAKTERYDAPGVGEDVRIEGDRIEGAALVHQRSYAWVRITVCAARFALPQDCRRG